MSFVARSLSEILNSRTDMWCRWQAVQYPTQVPKEDVWAPGVPTEPLVKEDKSSVRIAEDTQSQFPNDVDR